MRYLTYNLLLENQPDISLNNFETTFINASLNSAHRQLKSYTNGKIKEVEDYNLIIELEGNDPKPNPLRTKDNPLYRTDAELDFLFEAEIEQTIQVLGLGNDNTDNMSESVSAFDMSYSQNRAKTIALSSFVRDLLASARLINDFNTQKTTETGFKTTKTSLLDWNDYPLGKTEAERVYLHKQTTPDKANKYLVTNEQGLITFTKNFETKQPQFSDILGEYSDNDSLRERFYEQYLENVNLQKQINDNKTTYDYPNVTNIFNKTQANFDYIDYQVDNELIEIRVAKNTTETNNSTAKRFTEKKYFTSNNINYEIEKMNINIGFSEYKSWIRVRYLLEQTSFLNDIYITVRTNNSSPVDIREHSYIENGEYYYYLEDTTAVNITEATIIFEIIRQVN